jgi:hypothetical protein
MQARLKSGETLMYCGASGSEWPPVTWNQNACTYCTALVLSCSSRFEPQQINDNARTGVVGRLAWRRIPPGPVRDGRVHRGILLFSWQPLSGGVMIGAEVGRMTSRFGECRVPKYGRLMAFPRKV